MFSYVILCYTGIRTERKKVAVTVRWQSIVAWMVRKRLAVLAGPAEVVQMMAVAEQNVLNSVKWREGRLGREDRI